MLKNRYVNKIKHLLIHLYSHFVCIDVWSRAELALFVPSPITGLLHSPGTSLTHTARNDFDLLGTFKA
jgi:hypothetical protein